MPPGWYFSGCSGCIWAGVVRNGPPDDIPMPPFPLPISSFCMLFLVSVFQCKFRSCELGLHFYPSCSFLAQNGTARDRRRMVSPSATHTSPAPPHRTCFLPRPCGHPTPAADRRLIILHIVLPFGARHHDLSAAGGDTNDSLPLQSSRSSGPLGHGGTHLCSAAGGRSVPTRLRVHFDHADIIFHISEHRPLVLLVLCDRYPCTPIAY